jgi:hypothetical protein
MNKDDGDMAAACVATMSAAPGDCLRLSRLGPDGRPAWGKAGAATLNVEPGSGSPGQTTPKASIASATFLKPAMFAPFT